MRLRDDQLWFARAVMDGVGIDEAPRRLTAGPKQSATERLDIYRRGYEARLVECLADDYPVLKRALGVDAFESLCRRYVEHHPSRSPNLNRFGGQMAAFCRDELEGPASKRAFATDLASLEWAIVEVIHAPRSEPLTLERFSQVPPDGWGGACLEANTAFRLLELEYPVNAYFQAVLDGADPVAPGPAWSATLVYRSGTTIWRTDLAAPAFEVLSGLVAGETLAASLSRAEVELAKLDPAEASGRVARWFREWVADGLFVRVALRLGGDSVGGAMGA